MGRDALDAERVSVDPEALEATDPMFPEDWLLSDDDEDLGQDEGGWSIDDRDDAWFPEFLTDKVRRQFGLGPIPHPSDVAHPSFRLTGRAGLAVQHLAQALSAQDALQARLAHDPHSLRLMEEMVEGLGIAQLALLIEREDHAAQDRMSQELRKRASQTVQATQARRQRGEPKRQWALEQHRRYPSWSWTMLCQQVEAEFGLSEGAGRTVLRSIRHLLDSKQQTPLGEAPDHDQKS